MAMLWMCTSAASKSTLVKELLSFSMATQILRQTKEKHIVFTTKNKLLALTSALFTYLCEASIEVYQATADADVQIICVALQHATDIKLTIVVGHDPDLLVLLRPQTNNKRETVYIIARQEEIHQHKRDVLLFCDGMSGCDNIDYLKKEELRRKVTVFNEENSTHDDIAKASEEFILAMYGASRHKALDEHRYTSSNDSSSFSALSQVQHWLGNDLDPRGWSWKLIGNTLQNVTSLHPAQTKLLYLISCKCKTSCFSCKCKRAGFVLSNV
ncbi:hypothetical protein PR048_028349 [Dryococelus australis]|uniref:Uncharacterized protein n=1 Tax=Dryococelus australis TaxID=614101 RepID=A0ABQ9GJ06_9NEOP|nr:hypothetical protein PR048_028349 [Dryococelus australis]